VRAKAFAAFLAATVIAGALLAPAGAFAGKTHRIRRPASVDVEMQGHGTHGFGFALFTFGSRDDLLWLTRPSPGVDQSVTYFIRAHRGRTDPKAGLLDVRVGSLGRFRGHFHPAATATLRPERGCTGDPTTVEKGFFVGSFSFRGEGGYTTIHTHRERGRITRQGATSCTVPSGSGNERHRPSHQTKREKRRRQNELRLVAGDGNGGVSLQATREEASGPEESSLTNFQASTSEKFGRLRVFRSVSVIDFGADAATTFQAMNPTEPLTEAILTPPAPFSGSATFHLNDPETASWTGNLAVEMPGLGKVQLTGENIEAGACHGPSHCTKTLPEPLQRALEAGAGSFHVSGEATTEPDRGA
jgi:hypothetical protein